MQTQIFETYLFENTIAALTLLKHREDATEIMYIGIEKLLKFITASVPAVIRQRHRKSNGCTR